MNELVIVAKVSLKKPATNAGFFFAVTQRPSASA